MGLGLLTLRFAVAINIVAVAFHYSSKDSGIMIPLLTTVLSFLLLLGFFTWLSCCISVLIVAAGMIVLKDATLIPIATIAPLCLSLALAGPGGYSVDALLWGPRKITYPDQ